MSIEKYYTKYKLLDVPVVSGGHYFIRSVLVRLNAPYKEIPVDQVCDSHDQGDKEGEKKRQVLQMKPGLVDHSAFYTNTLDRRTSLCLWVSPPNEEGEVIATKKMVVTCTSSCATSSAKFKKPERARDMALVQTLEVQKPGGEVEVLARVANNVWPKADVNKRDYKKPERRKPKGGASEPQKRKRRASVPEPGCSDDDSAGGGDDGGADGAGGPSGMKRMKLQPKPEPYPGEVMESSPRLSKSNDHQYSTTISEPMVEIVIDNWRSMSYCLRAEIVNGNCTKLDIDNILKGE